MAITMVFQKIFQTKANFLEPEVMGYDTPELVQEYLYELHFKFLITLLTNNEYRYLELESQTIKNLILPDLGS
ncbi:7056_t:CDS:1, partial [Racocetra fulgida]